MKIYTSRKIKLLEHLPCIEGKPIHPADLAKEARVWILKDKDFATFHEIPFLVAQKMVRDHEIPCSQVKFVYLSSVGKRIRYVDEKIIQLDVKGEMVEPWPENPAESLFEIDFYLRYGK